MTATGVGGYWTRAEPLTLGSRAVRVARRLRSRAPAKWYSCETILERLAQDLEHMTATLRPFLQEEHTLVRQRHLARHRHLPPTDQPDIRDGIMGDATPASRDDGAACTGASGDVVHAKGADISGHRLPKDADTRGGRAALAGR